MSGLKTNDYIYKFKFQTASLKLLLKAYLFIECGYSDTTEQSSGKRKNGPKKKKNCIDAV